MPDDKFVINIPTAATLVGTTVSAVVYSAITTTGELTAAATSSGINLAGNLLGYGTELVAGSIAGNVVREVGKTYSILAKPAISNSSKVGALGLSILTGTGATLATAGIINGGQYLSSYLYSYYKEYKQKSAQTPIPTNEEIIAVD